MFLSVQTCKKAAAEHLYLEDTARAAAAADGSKGGFSSRFICAQARMTKDPQKARPGLQLSNSLDCWPLFARQVEGFFGGCARGCQGRRTWATNRNRNSSSCMTSRLNAVYFLHFFRKPGMIHLPQRQDVPVPGKRSSPSFLWGQHLKEPPPPALSALSWR